MTDIEPPAFVASVPHHAGLGNRLRFLLSSQAIADAEGRKFYYRWPVGERNGFRFGARLDELWDYDGGLAVDTPASLVEPMRVSATEGDLSAIRDDAIMHVSSIYELKGFGTEAYWGEILAEMKPADAVLKLVDEAASGLAAGYVSVQVRAHPTLTHSKTLELSPVSWFIDRMQQTRDRNSATQFFLSTDTEAAHAEIKARFPDAVSIRKTGDYNSREALIESTADLVMLSRSSHILAPYWSSFANIGWLMGRKAMPLENSQRVRNP